MITREGIEEAAQRISGYTRKTPIFEIEHNTWTTVPVLFKLEHLQHSGSFKVRGSFNCLLANQVPPTGVIAASGGNHGIAVAYVARQLGTRAEIFVPEIASRAKVERLRAYDAHVSIVGASYAEALLASEKRAQETGALVVHAYDQPEVVCGQGTLGREIEQQVPDVDTILVAVGGGGLIGGIASWFQGKTRIIGVESEQTASMTTALQVGHPVDVRVGGIVADALGAKRVGQLGFQATQQHVEQVLCVNDDTIRVAQRTLWEDMRILVEPSGATAFAALLSGAYQPAKNEKVVVLLCGANTPVTLA